MTKLNQRYTLARCIPNDEAWSRLSPERQRTLAERLLEESIEVIATGGHEPDSWESLELRCAIDALDHRLYASILVFVSRALMPAPDRHAFVVRPREAVTSLDDLRGAFALARGEPELRI